MQISFIQIFSLINICLSPDFVSDPIIEIQPRMNLKSISVNYDLCNGPLNNIPLIEWRSTSNSGLFIVELMFLINYKNFLSHYNSTQQIVTLKRYKKKQTFNERYYESLHAPKYILLPQENSNTTAFKLDIHVSDENDFGGLNSIDEQKYVISFHSSLKTPAKNISDIKKLNKQLLTHLFENIDELSNFGFQFFFMVIGEASDGKLVAKTVVSDFFGFEINEDESVLLTCVLNPDDFHLTPILNAIDEGRCSRLTRFFRRRYTSEGRSMCVVS